MIVQVVEGQSLNTGIRIVTGAIPVSALVRHAVVPYRDSLRKTGYQRRPQMTRINAFASELRRGRTDVPTSILLNMRRVTSEVITKGQGDVSSIDFSDPELRLYVVDGQHRYLAFEKLLSEDEDRWANYRLQFVLMLGADEDEEMNQFYVVNTTAKSVKTDLALDLLKHRAEKDGMIMHDLEEKGHVWKVDGQSIVDELYSSSSIWKGKIQLANREKSGTIIPAASFVTSLKSLLTSSPFFMKLDQEQRVRIIDAYWIGIRDALREPFEGNENDYALQKGIGVTAMHEILATVVEIIRSDGKSVFEPDSYRDVMQGVLEDLSGDNTSGANVSGAAFWLTAPKGGAAGSYSSSAGKRVLLAKLRTLLPAIAVE